MLTYGRAPLNSADCRDLSSPLGEALFYILYPASTQIPTLDNTQTGHEHNSYSYQVSAVHQRVDC